MRVPAMVGGPVSTNDWAYSHASCASVSVAKDLVFSRYLLISGRRDGLFSRTYEKIIAISSPVGADCPLWWSSSGVSNEWEWLSHSSASAISSSLSLEWRLWLWLLSTLSSSDSSSAKSSYWFARFLAFGFPSSGCVGFCNCGDLAITVCQSVPSSYGSDFSLWSLKSWFGAARFVGGGVPGGLARFVFPRLVGFRRKSRSVNSRRREVWLDGVELPCCWVVDSGEGRVAAIAASEGRSMLVGNPVCCRMVVPFRWCVSGVRRRYNVYAWGEGSSLQNSGKSATNSSMSLSCAHSSSVASWLMCLSFILMHAPKYWSTSLSASSVVVLVVWFFGIGRSWIVLSVHSISIPRFDAQKAL